MTKTQTGSHGKEGKKQTPGKDRIRRVRKAYDSPYSACDLSIHDVKMVIIEKARRHDNVRGGFDTQDLIIIFNDEMNKEHAMKIELYYLPKMIE